MTPGRPGTGIVSFTGIGFRFHESWGNLPSESSRQTAPRPRLICTVRTPKSRYLLLGTAILAALAGFWITRDILRSVRDLEKSRDNDGRSYTQYDAPNMPSKAPGRPGARRAPGLDELFFGVPGERIVRFDSDDDYRAFLGRLAGSEVRLVGKLDSLRAVRLRFDDSSQLDDLLDDDEGLPNFRVSIPDLPQVGAQPGAVGFGRSTLAWLGISDDNSTWGEGVRIAMLDTGIGQHASLGERVREIDLVTGDGPAIDLHGHGTAVASLMIGDDGVSQGIAPAAELLSIRIADSNGSSNSFLLAEGIVRAVDEGAQIINISMGSYGDSLLVQEAIGYAAERQVVIVAAAGNEGFTRPSYPAAYDSVIAVGAVDAAGQHLDFSNSGESIDVTAPGFEIVSAWPGEEYTSFTGTSAAAPLVVGALAATMTETESGSLLPLQAVTVMENNLNAAGAPGNDPLHGGGNLDVDRMVNAFTPGRFDLAVASNWYEPPSDGDVVGTLQVTVQNQGTEAMAGTTLDVMINDSVFPITLPRLQGGGSHVVELPINEPTGTEAIGVRSTVNLNGNEDRDPANNTLAGNVRLAGELLPEPLSPGAD